LRVQDGEGYYTIGEVAARVGVSSQTLRVWEQKALIAPGRSNGRQRLYSEDDLRRAKQIALMRRRHGWNPAAIRSSLAARPDSGAWAQLSLGMRLRLARRSRGLTLRNAARLVGVSRSFLSSVERGENAPSSRLFASLANAYKMPTTAWVAGPDPETYVVRATDRPRTTIADGVTWEELVSPGHVLEPALLIVPPGASSGGAYSRPGEVFVFVLAGALVFSIDGGESIQLDEGDSIILKPPSPWTWYNGGDREARAVYVEQLGAEDWT
jgi:DNA-binding transcriptional MerR regulator/quercetin dioxygenase-like cupin family protein